MRGRQTAFGLLIAALLLLGLLSVFAIELSNTQAKSKADVQARVHERAVLAAALIDGLLQSASQQVPQYARTYGTATVSPRTLERNKGQNAYAALLDDRGTVLASSSGFTVQARTDLSRSSALALVRAGHPYALGNVLPYGKTGVINYAVAIPTAYGRRILLTGFAPSGLGLFFAGDLHKIPGVKGAHNYLIDGNGTVIASTNPARPPGYVFATAAATALQPRSGDRNGFYYDQVQLANSTERIVLSAPNGPLFASVSGFRKWVPWLIFIGFAVAAVLALILARRSLRAAELVRNANARLEIANADLAGANDALKRRAVELARSNAELEQFASIASHDLQEPLRKVRTFTQQVGVTESDRLSDKGADYLQRANSAAERMQRLIEDLLKFSRVATHARPFTSVDLAEVTREVMEDLSDQIERSEAEIEVGAMPTITAEPIQMRQLMQNLVSNAVKFRREGVPPQVMIDAPVADGMVQITVRDNGIGFEPQYTRRIFRVFERLHTRSEYPGTGIGLALCRKIVERHGGRMTAHSIPGEGSTFIATLPVEQRTEFPPDRPSGEGEATRSREETYAPA